ncbi:hypothetical protein LCM17_12825 [Cereibacter sphaeroides]|nr:hypothetical protein [Cereibacter sphaeroides]
MSLHHRSESAAEIADWASLSALMICLARELAAVPPKVPIWRFPVAGGWLEASMTRPLASGLPPIAALTLQNDRGAHPISPGPALALLTDQLCTDHPATGPELARRIRASRARIARIVAARLHEPADPLDFLAGEQALIFGHWMHPAPKYLGGISEAEERRLTPDWRGGTQLTALKVQADLLETGGTAATGDLPGFGPGLLPVHPLSWDRQQRRPEVQALLASGAIRDLGPRGPIWHATSSVRTLWCPESPFMVKVSLPVVITNSERLNKRHELLAGVAMAQHLASLSGRFGALGFVTDPGWATLRLPGQAESGFEVILRDNPYRSPRGGAVVHLAALAAPGVGTRPSLLARLLTGQEARRWFDAYLDVALAPLLRLYDATGIAFEAHQQNVLLALKDGLPVRADLRDNQGFYVVEDRAPPALRAIPQLTYPRAEAEAALAYTLLVNQVFGLIHRLDRDGLLPEACAMSALAERLAALAAELPGAGGQLAAAWLRDRVLPAKGNLLTQLGGVDELLLPGETPPAIQVHNPLPERVRARRLSDVA